MHTFNGRFDTFSLLFNFFDIFWHIHTILERSLLSWILFSLILPHGLWLSQWVSFSDVHRSHVFISISYWLLVWLVLLKHIHSSLQNRDIIWPEASELHLILADREVSSIPLRKLKRGNPFVVILRTISRLESTHVGLLTFQVVRFELLHRFTPFFYKNVVNLPQVSLSSSESGFVCLMCTSEFVKVKAWPHLWKR